MDTKFCQFNQAKAIGSKPLDEVTYFIISLATVAARLQKTSSS